MFYWRKLFLTFKRGFRNLDWSLKKTSFTNSFFLLQFDIIIFQLYSFSLILQPGWLVMEGLNLQPRLHFGSGNKITLWLR